MRLATFAAITMTLADVVAADRIETRIDEVFAPWSRSDSPGCSMAVTRDGRLLVERGYGMADLEQGIAIRPDTVFNMASVSKQFTAAAVVLLAQDGRLTLDDDVRQYLPELPDYGWPITIRYLGNHTSGLRDYAFLLGLGGWNWVDAVPEQKAMDVIARQENLNFEPGTEYSYSNTGYFLMAVLVERVSGMKFGDFAEQRIFAPLGMRHSRIYDDRRMVMKNRAVGHLPLGGGGVGVWRPTYELVGDGALLTTVQDMARWERNFNEPRLGRDPQALVEALTTPGRLNDGSTIDYAFGLVLDEYRGLRTVEHSGGIPGYATEMLRFPEQGLSVQVMCNMGGLPADELARSVADLYLEDAFHAPPAAREPEDVDDTSPEPIALPGALEAYTGTYYSEELDAEYKIDSNAGMLWVQIGYLPPIGFVPVAEDRFVTRDQEEDSYALRFLRQAGYVVGFVIEAHGVFGIEFTRRPSGH